MIMIFWHNLRLFWFLVHLKLMKFFINILYFYLVVIFLFFSLFKLKTTARNMWYSKETTINLLCKAGFQCFCFCPLNNKHTAFYVHFIIRHILTCIALWFMYYKFLIPRKLLKFKNPFMALICISFRLNITPDFLSLETWY